MSGGLFSGFSPLTPRPFQSTSPAENVTFRAAVTTVSGVERSDEGQDSSESGGRKEYAVLTVQGEGITVFDVRLPVVKVDHSLILMLAERNPGQVATSHPILARSLLPSTTLSAPALLLPSGVSSSNSKEPRGTIIAPVQFHPASVPEAEHGRHIWLWRFGANGNTAQNLALSATKIGPDDTAVMEKPVHSLHPVPSSIARSLEKMPSDDDQLFLAYNADTSFSVFHTSNPTSPLLTSTLDSVSRTTRLQSRIRRRAVWASLFTLPSTNTSDNDDDEPEEDVIVVDVFETDVPTAQEPHGPTTGSFSAPPTRTRRSSVATTTDMTDTLPLHSPTTLTPLARGRKSSVASITGTPLSAPPGPGALRDSTPSRMAREGTPSRHARESSPFFGSATTPSKPSSSKLPPVHRPIARVRSLGGSGKPWSAEVSIDVGRGTAADVVSWAFEPSRGWLAALAQSAVLLFRLPLPSSTPHLPPPGALKPHLIIPLTSFSSPVPLALTPTANSVTFLDSNHIGVAFTTANDSDGDGSSSTAAEESTVPSAYLSACDLRFSAPRGCAAIHSVDVPVPSVLIPDNPDMSLREDTEITDDVRLALIGGSAKVLAVHVRSTSTGTGVATGTFMATLHAAPF
ncbi:hypothetical protein HDU93_008272, partial [Gonapodya sp. JEL0774]